GFGAVVIILPRKVNFDRVRGPGVLGGEWFEALDATATQTSARWADARVGERTAFGGGGAQRVAITARAEQTACDEQAAHEWPTEENVRASTSHDLFPL